MFWLSNSSINLSDCLIHPSIWVSNSSCYRIFVLSCYLGFLFWFMRTKGTATRWPFPNGHFSLICPTNRIAALHAKIIGQATATTMFQSCYVIRLILVRIAIDILHHVVVFCSCHGQQAEQLIHSRLSHALLISRLIYFLQPKKIVVYFIYIWYLFSSSRQTYNLSLVRTD